MPTSRKKVIPKKKRGRPATGRDPVYAVRLPDEVVNGIDKWAKANGHRDRSAAIRAMIERALAKD
jgi:predicted DNA-binding protein